MDAQLGASSVKFDTRSRERLVGGLLLAKLRAFLKVTLLATRLSVAIIHHQQRQGYSCGETTLANDRRTSHIVAKVQHHLPRTTAA